MDLAAEAGNKQYMNQKAVYKGFPIWIENSSFFSIK